MFFNLALTFYLQANNPIKQQIPNAAISVATMVAPTGVSARMEIINPIRAHTTERAPEKIVTFLKLLKIRIAESAGKIISAETSSEPTSFIATTMITAIITAISRLYAFTLLPTALAKFSSKVTAKILL